MDHLGGKIKAGLDEFIKPTVLMFVAPANAVVQLVNVSPGTATLGNSGAVGDPEVPAAYISFLQIQ